MPEFAGIFINDLKMYAYLTQLSFRGSVVAPDPRQGIAIDL